MYAWRYLHMKPIIIRCNINYTCSTYALNLISAEGETTDDEIENFERISDSSSDEGMDAQAQAEREVRKAQLAKRVLKQAELLISKARNDILNFNLFSDRDRSKVQVLSSYVWWFNGLDKGAVLLTRYPITCVYYFYSS